MLAAFAGSFTTMVTYNVKNAVLSRYLAKTGGDAGRDTSQVWTAISSSVPEFIVNLLDSGLQMVPHLAFTVAYCGLAAYYLRTVSLWMFLVLALMAVLLWIINKGFDQWYTRQVQNRVRGNRILFQIYKGIEKIRSRSAQKRMYLRWAKVFSEEAYCDKQRKKFIAAGTGIKDFVNPLLSVVLLAAVMQTPISSSNLLTGTLLAGLLAGQVSELTAYVERIVNSRSLWSEISFLFDPEESGEKKMKCSDFTASLRVSHLTFAYPGMERLLDDISFSVKEGEYVGIVGMSGCGKSTLLKLILGILTPTKGEISYGRYELADTDQRSILRNIGIVLQNESLIPGTIRQNMMMQPTPVTEEEIWDTLEKVKIADRVRSYAHGLDMEITAFETSHDVKSVGFSIEYEGERFVVATDMGVITERAAHYMRAANYLMLECNYDLEMLEKGKYPAMLKDRVKGDKGHLDNRVAAQFVADNYHDAMRYVFLCHLSKDNNTEEIALSTMRQALEARNLSVGDGSNSVNQRNRNVQIYALPRYSTSAWFVLA